MSPKLFGDKQDRSVYSILLEENYFSILEIVLSNLITQIKRQLEVMILLLQ